MACATCYTHLPYSPDLAPSDLNLFLTVKEKLERIYLIQEHSFFECLQEIVKDIDQNELNGIFQAWVRRVHNY
jgi:hypothetical protein